MCFKINFVQFRNSIGEFMDTQYSCCSVELAALIYALIHNVVTALASIACLVWLIGHVFWYFILSHSDARSLLTDLLICGIATGTMVISIASFAFGVVLAKGILMKRAKFILAYIYYGLLVVTVCLSTAIAQFAIGRDFDAYIVCALIIVVACVIFSIILGIIWMTYKKYRTESQFDHRYFQQRPITTL